ncbi:DUF802 domain-containing protein [Ideonella sp. BN130291]|uniref:DUF802 domain-containing protein n=1 Tax=Ideonella sp. BN130291 TaxID=3112940 RepID=UPI002E261935|nr:DUF802 domain-containing protein [Ideonella sp. BN130291]
MNKPLYYATGAAGAAALCWIAAGYGGSHPLALAMTALIAGVYAWGVLELQRFRAATASLAQAVAGLNEPPPALAAWLERLHTSLRNPVRLRIEGDRVGLPGPAMTPYLAGLLVLLGMLGTFLGMVLTLQGTSMALESSNDLQAIRASLAAPVKGLGLAFGTSVAGVAASAMLGLMSALCRRDRQLAAQALDAAIATTLRPFSLVHQREQSLRLQQLQAESLPALASQLQALMATMERQSEALGARLAAEQERFHSQAQAAYTGLAESVDRSLKASLTESARVAAASLQPAAEATMAGIARETTALHTAVAQTVQQQLDGLSARFDAATSRVAHTWEAALGQHQRAGEGQLQALQATLAQFAQTFEQRSAALVAAVGRAQADEHAALVSGDTQRLAAWTEALQAQAGSTIDQITRLVNTAAEAPKAAAEVIAQLRQSLSDSLVRDNAMLDERARILQTLSGLLDTLNHASTEQRDAIDTLVASSTQLLEGAGARLAEQVQAHSGRLDDVAAQLTGSAVEVASLGEAFGLAVQLFSQSNDKLMAQLQRIEGTLTQSIARSDEQLAYYVAQAREIIDLSLMSQKQIVDELRQLSSRQAAALGEA